MQTPEQLKATAQTLIELAEKLEKENEKAKAKKNFLQVDRRNQEVSFMIKIIQIVALPSTETENQSIIGLANTGKLFEKVYSHGTWGNWYEIPSQLPEGNEK